MADNVKTMEGAKAPLGETVERARSAVSEKVGEAKEKLHGVSGELGAKVREGRDRASEYAKERYGVAKEKVGQGYDRARKDIDQLAADVNVYVRDNPGRAVLIAAGVGFLVGFLLRGGERR
ncbi:MAG: DUF883 family protein [Acidobacteria bacterium]|nr:MAG: DUF883 family protein [Acidobacteriota bacterium]REK10319.1 MAG: DUF883 family protein [Acidobacteriota bacterium]